MKAIEVRNKFLKFFEENGHKVIESAPLIPEDDSSVLFNIAGMQPLKPYLMGKKHPDGVRLTDYQKCLRTNDIEEVGDNNHLTYFEMLGNWSLGDYFKEESIQMTFDFLTKELGIPIEKLSVTVFAGDEDCERDDLTASCWKKAGILPDQIYYYGKEHNWWIAGEEGPCGSDTEIYYDTGKVACGHDCQPSCDCGKYVEIWNNVFMEFYKHKDGHYTKLNQHNVDTGLGLERITFILQGKETPFDTEIFKPVMDKLTELAANDILVSKRIVAEHMRASIMIISDGGKPSNVDRGYVLRKLIRRMVRHMNKLQISLDELSSLLELNIKTLSELYPALEGNKELIITTVIDEKNKFIQTLEKGKREFHKAVEKARKEDNSKIDGLVVFKLYETYGFPPELTKELAEEAGMMVDTKEFDVLFKQHQEKSRAGAGQKFKGGLSDASPETIAYHTATHLLNAALKVIVGPEVKQKGSNITSERMRFDFKCNHKLTNLEKQQVEDLVNKWIQEGLNVTMTEMSKDEALKSGAECVFIEKYPDVVKVYAIGDVSKEICGGPHVSNTSELGTFIIQKEEASSAGVRRIKAILRKE